MTVPIVVSSSSFNFHSFHLGVDFIFKPEDFGAAMALSPLGMGHHTAVDLVPKSSAGNLTKLTTGHFRSSAPQFLLSDMLRLTATNFASANPFSSSILTLHNSRLSHSLSPVQGWHNLKRHRSHRNCSAVDRGVPLCATSRSRHYQVAAHPSQSDKATRAEIAHLRYILSHPASVRLSVPDELGIDLVMQVAGLAASAQAGMVS